MPLVGSELPGEDAPPPPPPLQESRGGDRISALPDDVLRHALGFLPVREAVRTSVLAPRWRHLWRSLPRLRITDVGSPWSLEKLSPLVDRLLLHRDPGLAIDQCEFDLGASEEEDLMEVTDAVGRWIRHALLLQTRVLRLSSPEESIVLPDQRLVSQYLRVLRLSGVELFYDALDFSSCSVLEDLQITSSDISAYNIRSPSLTRLTLVNCTFLGPSTRTRIAAPRLVWLKLEYCDCITPLLESMPSLENASIRLGCDGEDHCEEGCSAHYCGRCMNCHDDGVCIDGCVLLGGLSNVTNLKFRASFGMFTFKMDLPRCPTFHKLKTLCLTDWCFVPDLCALLGFLRHTPNLEKLTLQLCQNEKCAKIIKDTNSLEWSFSLSQLKIVEVKCVKIDGRVRSTLKILSKIGICLEQFNIQKI
ncbi:hypothetical protein ACP70R_003792 [Stipagrostis hirtigluma subsp. patula]